MKMMMEQCHRHGQTECKNEGWIKREMLTEREGKKDQKTHGGEHFYKITSRRNEEMQQHGGDCNQYVALLKTPRGLEHIN